MVNEVSFGSYTSIVDNSEWWIGRELVVGVAVACFKIFRY